MKGWRRDGCHRERVGRKGRVETYDRLGVMTCRMEYIQLFIAVMFYSCSEHPVPEVKVGAT